MPDFINLTCPSCGGKLQITNDIDRFACGHCGNELIVRRSGGAITIAPVVEGLKEVKAGVDKTASELAIPRLEGEISNLRQQRKTLASLGCGVNGLVGLLCLSIFVSFMIITGVKIDSTNIGQVFFFGALFIVFAVFVYFVRRYEKNKAQKRVEPVDRMIAEKEQELEKHRNIVRNV